MYVLDAPKKVCTELHIYMAAKEHSEVRVVWHNMLVGEDDILLLALIIMMGNSVGVPILWPGIVWVMVAIH